MKITFVYRAVESFGLEYLAAALKRDRHQVDLVFDPDLFGPDHYLACETLRRRYDRLAALPGEIAARAPDLVGFSVPTVYYRWAIAVARGFKQLRPATPVIFGGIHPTAVPAEVLANDCVDYVVVGEGDEALPELAGALARGDEGAGIRNVWRKDRGRLVPQPVRPLLRDLDQLPPPDKELFAGVLPFDYLYKTAAGRGCPFRCSFCCHSLLKRIYPADRPAVRMRSPGAVLHELRSAQRRWGYRFVHLDDDTLTFDRDWLAEFLAGYRREIRVPFSAVSHPLCVDAERARWLRESGCFLLELGVQTLNPELRRRVLDRTESNAAIIRALDACELAGLPFQVDHIFGLPGETDADHVAAYELYRRYRQLARIETFQLTYHPGTAILDRVPAITPERQATIAAGHEPMYFQAGSLTDPAVLRAARRWRFLFKLLTTFPRGVADAGRRFGLDRVFPFLPEPLVTLCEALNALRRGDRRPLYYLRFYRRHWPARSRP